MGFCVRNVVFHHKTEDRYRGPNSKPSIAILLSKLIESIIGPLSNWFHPNQIGITLKEPAVENLMVRSGSIVAGDLRKSWDATSAPPQRIKVEEALPITGCRRNDGNIRDKYGLLG